ncbi:DEAD/DEAH box helicase [Reyranella aquatilis]|uniref:DEAD/DEAH box helicase n=1 Tax=Reyranella aquatilis TaxID=2035356 RepID=A0ABS8L293_9HYPH|nr:DEAD/DEAH box helicase [Reyranella aquatilis]MCC8432440.1 DEAD/DEAH box helicase [Reyranella aquatilis]
MSLSELQDWLIAEGIDSDLDIVAHRSIRAELDNLLDEPEEAPSRSIDWPRLLFAGSLLARSERRDHQEAALRIATGAISIAASQSVKDAGAVLLGKLSNFQAIELAIKRDLLAPGFEGRLGVSLRLETQRRQLEQSILIQSNGRWLPANKFQNKFWTEAGNQSWLSASAPTASGKTFLISRWLVDQILTSNVRVVVYLAPTRALVSEVEANLISLLGKNSGIEVSSLPVRTKYDAAVSGGARLVVVYTQERLHLFANSIGDGIAVDLLIVDEAHKIGDNQRGVIMQDAVERISRSNGKLKTVFVSPATQNPEVLLADAPVGATSLAIQSDAPTVLQNLIVAEQVPRMAKLWKLSVLRDEKASLPIGVLRLASSPSGHPKQLAFIAAAVGERGGTLVYANGAAAAEKVASLVSQLLPEIKIVDQELLELADLAQKGVHPKFALVPLVKKGVAFHYGNMPSLLRSEIERLFRAGKIRFLICTSTLIEGVNLSCRNIVMRGPRKGTGRPMKPHDFWNLAGRAGRWGSEFQGNIICIDPGDSEAWPDGIPRRTRYLIKRESDAVLELNDEALTNYLANRATKDVSELKDADKFEQVGSYLLATRLRLGSLVNANLAKRHAPSAIAKLDETLALLASQIGIGMDLVDRHPGVSALGLQRLLDGFRAYRGDVQNLMPATVDSLDSLDRFVTIMKRINQYLYPAFVPEKRARLFALIVVQWLKGLSLAAIIRKNIDYHVQTKRPYRLPALIRETMELVEQVARFSAPKYLSAYVDVLKLHLREIGREDLISDELDIGMQLEFGISSQTLLSLMELGLSRFSAVALYELIARDDLSKEDCLVWISEREANFEGMDIPAIILREIREKLVVDDAG